MSSIIAIIDSLKFMPLDPGKINSLHLKDLALRIA